MISIARRESIVRNIGCDNGRSICFDVQIVTARCVGAVVANRVTGNCYIESSAGISDSKIVLNAAANVIIRKSAGANQAVENKAAFESSAVVTVHAIDDCIYKSQISHSRSANCVISEVIQLHV